MSLYINGEDDKDDKVIKTQPFEIEDTPVFDKDCYVRLSSNTIATISSYEIRFKNGPYRLLPLEDSITIAFDPTVSLPYGSGLEQMDIYIKTGVISSFYKKISSVPIVMEGNNHPLPISIRQNEYVTVRLGKGLCIKNPYTASLYRVQIKTSRQNGYAVSMIYPIIPDKNVSS
ncbi:MAG: hypothetical protein R2883_04070 [Caldisericia bacterium]